MTARRILNSMCRDWHGKSNVHQPRQECRKSNHHFNAAAPSRPQRQLWLPAGCGTALSPSTARRRRHAHECRRCTPVCTRACISVNEYTTHTHTHTCSYRRLRMRMLATPALHTRRTGGAGPRPHAPHAPPPPPTPLPRPACAPSRARRGSACTRPSRAPPPGPPRPPRGGTAPRPTASAAGTPAAGSPGRR